MEEKVLVKREHGYTNSIRLPRSFFKKLGLQLSREVILEVTNSNPLAWEIKVTPVLSKDGIESAGKGKGKDKPA